jgi:glycine hydroxymethyltransferase
MFTSIQKSHIYPTSCGNVRSQDLEMALILDDELARQRDQIEMIASENFTSLAVMETQASTLTNKYAEGYPGQRYYGGCRFIDKAEKLACKRVRKIFNCSYANVQPHSGSQANQAVFAAFMKPGDTFMGMDLSAGGHLTHGSKANMSGKWFNAVSYSVNNDSHLIDMDEVRQRAHEFKPKIIIAGGSAYSRVIDFAGFRSIADEVGAILMVDMSHFAGLVAGGVFPSPLPHAHVVTSTTHKTLRGPRGGIILAQDDSDEKKLNSAVFPFLQGGPLMHLIAAKGVAFGEILKPAFKEYAHQVVANARTLAQTLINEDIQIVTGGTDCHLILVDLSNLNITGADAESALERAGITCNKNSIPFDPLPPMKPSGIRLGSPAATTRGLQESEFKLLGQWIARILKATDSGQSESSEQNIRRKIKKLCDRFPLYPELQEGA